MFITPMDYIIISFLSILTGILLREASLYIELELKQ